jgi:hypothetical protein
MRRRPAPTRELQSLLELSTLLLDDLIFLLIILCNSRGVVESPCLFSLQPGGSRSF